MEWKKKKRWHYFWQTITKSFSISMGYKKDIYVKTNVVFVLKRTKGHTHTHKSTVISIGNLLQFYFFISSCFYFIVHAKVKARPVSVVWCKSHVYCECEPIWVFCVWELISIFIMRMFLLCKHFFWSQNLWRHAPSTHATRDFNRK